MRIVCLFTVSPSRKAGAAASQGRLRHSGGSRNPWTRMPEHSCIPRWSWMPGQARHDGRAVVQASVKWAAAGLILVALILIPFLLFEEQVMGLAGNLSGGQAGALVALAIVALFAGDVFLPV